MVDEIYYQVNNVTEKTILEVGGTGLNAALAFQKENFEVILFGKVGNDSFGKMIIDWVKKNNFENHILIDAKKKTGICKLYYSSEDQSSFRLPIDYDDANYFDSELLKEWFGTTKISKNDFVFFTGHFLLRNKFKESIKIAEEFSQTHAKLIFDLVPHKIYNDLEVNSLKDIFKIPIFLTISEYQTLALLHGFDRDYIPNIDECNLFFSSINTKYLELRYGKNNISTIMIASKNTQNNSYLVEKKETDFESIDIKRIKGFGDILTAKTLCNILNEKN